MGFFSRRSKKTKSPVVTVTEIDRSDEKLALDTDSSDETLLEHLQLDDSDKHAVIVQEEITFDQLLGSRSDYAVVHKEIHAPTTPEVVAHLKLLKAFDTLRKKIRKQYIVRSQTDAKSAEFNRELLWKDYLTNAVRRFVLWVSALQYACDRKEVISRMDRMLPPLDVVLVWHSFLLNPKTIYDQFHRNGFTEFLKYPLPLFRLSQSIDNETFIYKPSKFDEDACTSLVYKYLEGFKDKMSFSFDAYARFNPIEVLVPVCCPTCKENICEYAGKPGVPLPMFGSPHFQLKPKYCSCDTKYLYLNHDTLRSLQLIKDSKLKKTLPGIVKYFSLELNDVFNGKAKCIEVNDKVKLIAIRLVQQGRLVQTLPAHLFSEYIRISGVTRLILREYMSMNLIYLTIPHTKVFELHEDLVSSCLRQQKFIVNMQTLGWLESSHIKLTVTEAIDRYHKFFKILKTDGYFKVPTLDIDLVWHTHQLSQPQYFRFCKTYHNHVIDHNDKVEENTLNDSFAKTSQLYKSKYKEEYTVCNCVYCTSIRVHSKSLNRDKFKLVKPDLDFDHVNKSHISCHPAMVTPTLRVLRQVKKRRKVVKDESLPFVDRDYRIRMYVNPPSVVFLNRDKRKFMMFYRHRDKNGEVGDPLSACVTAFVPRPKDPIHVYEHSQVQGICTGCYSAECGTYEDGNLDGGDCAGTF